MQQVGTIRKSDKENCGDWVCLKAGIVVRRTAAPMSLPSVNATMVIEELGAADGHDDVHHTVTTELFAMSVHSLCAVVDHVYDQLVEL